jgi:Carboxypeptidase regulatory-like domain/Ankyrin repeats (3 copies)
MSDTNLSKLLSFKSPCSEDWDSMTGTDLIRFCEHCRLSVHDVSEMNSKQFRRLLARSGGRLCVRYVQPSTYMSSAAPVLHKIGRRAGILAASAFTASLSMSSAVAGKLPQSIGHTSSLTPAASKSLLTTPLGRGTATISGTIFDPQGAVITRAIVSLTKMETKDVLTTTTDGSGVYKFDGLEAGVYNLKMEADGFAASDVPNVTVHADGNNRIDQTLSVATITATVEITAPAIQSVTSGVVAVASPTQPLVKAASADDLTAVNQVLTENPNANIRDEATGANALECAVRNGNREIIQVLLWAKADVNSRDSNGQTPLMMIDEQSTTDLVWDLLSAGAKVNLHDRDGETALMAAAMVNNTEVLKTLLDAGAKVNVTTNDGVTALMLAADEGHVNNVRLLILAGAEINARDKTGKTALEYAQENDHAIVVRLLKQHGAITFENREEKE